MKFTKMQGAGNDFIIIDNRNEKIPYERFPYIARRLCSRKLSIGADGLMVVSDPENGGDFRMDLFNSDGSIGEMCGNGARCIARFGYENGFASETVQIETVSGTVTAVRNSQRDYTVHLNDPSLTDGPFEISANGNTFKCYYFELGDPGLPHAVIICESMDKYCTDSLREAGRCIRHDPRFPKGANVTFCEVTGQDSVKAVTFERGVEDFTLACGTGCGALTAALTLDGSVSGNNVRISEPGGELTVTLTKDNKGIHDIYLTGPTNFVAEGTVKDEDLIMEEL